jgi:nitrite reductase/ring-hydroxylating ferredoxin subunit
LIGPWSKFSDSIIKIYHFRRHLGVTVFFLGTLHVVIILPRYFSYSIKGALSSIFIFYGLTSFFLLFWLAITSWDHLQKKVKDMTWKAIHLILLLIYISISYYMYTIQKTFNESTLNYHLIVIGIFILIWIIIAPYSFIKKIMSTNIFGWKQLHVLIWIVYSSLLLHVYFGPLSTTNNLVKTIFWVSIITIISSHVVGWVKRFYEDKGINDKINSINKTININNKDYVGVDHINNFKEGEGKKFYVNKKQIAVFKYKNNFIAISNICAHQKGPLYKGKINSGYVECPWHQWQYNIKDGCGPPGFSDCVPYYDAKVVKDILFISKDHSKNK